MNICRVGAMELAGRKQDRGRAEVLPAGRETTGGGERAGMDR